EATGRIPERLRKANLLTSAQATGTDETGRGTADHKPSAAHGALFTATIGHHTALPLLIGLGLAQSLTTTYRTDWCTASTATRCEDNYWKNPS
ncbi:hypothetical protein HPB47_023923, partial [Ixodes persulcatus]